MKGGFGPGKSGAGPGVAAEVEGILMAFGFVFVLEAVRAVGAGILFFGFV